MGQAEDEENFVSLQVRQARRHDGPMSHIDIRPAEERDLSALGRLGAIMVRLHHGFDSDRFMAPGTNVEEGYAWFLGTQLKEDDVATIVSSCVGCGLCGEVTQSAALCPSFFEVKVIRNPDLWTRLSVGFNRLLSRALPHV